MARDRVGEKNAGMESTTARTTPSTTALPRMTGTADEAAPATIPKGSGPYVSNGFTLEETPERIGLLESVPEHERTDHDALWSRLRRDGYLLLRDQIPREVILEFRRYYFQAVADAGLIRTGSDPVEGIAAEPEDLDRAALRQALFQVVVPSPEYQELCSRPEIRDWFSWLLQDDVHLHRRKLIRHTQPGETGIGTATQAHYDLVYLREGTDRVLSMWIPLGDTPIHRGGLLYLEGSHHKILREEAQAGEKRPAAWMSPDLPGIAEEYDGRWLLADYRAGDVVVHSAHMVHAALDNSDPGGVMRLSTDIRYQRVGDPIDWRWQEHWHDGDGL